MALKNQGIPPVVFFFPQNLAEQQKIQLHCAKERGKENQMTTFQIQNDDTNFSEVSHKEFFKIINESNDYLYYKQGGCHIAMLPTEKNAKTLHVCRQLENAENYGRAVNSRCRDEKGHVCRYQHNANGSIIRNEAGKPVSAKCSECPRDGWIAGKRENCCIRNYCKVADCTYCTRRREYHAPISLEWLMEDKGNLNETDGGGFSIADPAADILAILERDELNSALYAAIDRLPSDEKAVLKALYWDQLTQRAYAAKAGISKSEVNRRHIRALEALRISLKDFS